MIVKGNEMLNIDGCCGCCWTLSNDRELSCSLYEERLDLWHTPEEAAEQLAAIIAANPGTQFEGAATFDACANWDADHPEDNFGVIYVGRRGPTVEYGERVYEKRKLRELKESLRLYILNDLEAAEQGYVPYACEQAGVTPDILRMIGLDDIADEFEADELDKEEEV